MDEDYYDREKPSLEYRVKNGERLSSSISDNESTAPTTSKNLNMRDSEIE